MSIASSRRLSPLIDTKHARAGDTPFFCGQEKIPDAPFLLLVPLALQDQWCQEATRFLQPGRFKVFRYNPGKGQLKDYFAKDGPWHEKQKSPDGSEHEWPMGMRIVIATTTVSPALDTPWLKPST